jgi:hypothetical protein
MGTSVASENRHRHSKKSKIPDRRIQKKTFVALKISVLPMNVCKLLISDSSVSENPNEKKVNDIQTKELVAPP